jgi:hypothetical protein
MSAASMKCPGCGRALAIPEPVRSGRKLKCPQCETVFSVPGGAPEPEPLAGDDFEEEEEDEEPIRPRRRRKSTERQLIWVLVALGGFLSLVFLGGCIAGVAWMVHRSRDRANVLAFDNTIAGANAKLRSAGIAFGVQLAPLLREGKQPDVRALRQAQQNAVRTVANVRAEINALQVPRAVSAQALFETYQHMLQNQETLVKKTLAEIIAVVEDRRLSAQQKTEKISEIFVQMQKVESNDLSAVQAAQRKMAEEYRIELRYQ